MNLDQLEVLADSQTGSQTAKVPQVSIWDFLTKDISIGSGNLSDKKKERFYWELQVLLSSGIDIKTSLEIIVRQMRGKEKDLFEKISSEVIGGKNLSHALEKCGKFSPYEFHSLRIGEESGRINEVLEQLASYYADKIQQSRQIISAVSYPCIILMTVAGVLLFMIHFVIPMFADVFKRFNADLPVITKTIIHISELFSSYSFPVFILLISAGITLYLQRKRVWFRNYFSSIILKLPLAGEIVRKIYLARFCHSMGLLTSAHNPLVSSLELVGKMVSFYPLERSLTIIELDVLKGIPLHSSLQKFSIYDDRMVSLVKVAEETNQLGVIFKKLGEQYSEEVKHRTSVIGNLLEPMMIILIGIFVAVILVAMYLPMFKLGTAIG